jgi:SNF2 family DNA or RNA helicase
VVIDVKEVNKKTGDVKEIEQTKIIEQIRENLLPERKNTFDPKNLNEGECGICQELPNNLAVLSCCGNVVCVVCIIEWMKKLGKQTECIYCRKLLGFHKLIYIPSLDHDKLKTKVTAPLESKKTKIETLLEIIQTKIQSEETRILIFGGQQRTSHGFELNTFENISKGLLRIGVDCGVVKGNRNTRNKKVTDYKKGRVKVLFLDSPESYAGLDLPETTDIIIMNELEICLEEQAIGRAQRFGRKKELQVHKLIYGEEGEIDETRRIDDHVDVEEDVVDIEYSDAEDERSVADYVVTY